MPNSYNQYNFKFNFKLYLKKKGYGPITVKNYVSDLHSFLVWSKKHLAQLPSPKNAQTYFSAFLVADFKQSLINKGLSKASINRSLASIRKFFSFCISQGWMRANPAKSIANEKTYNQENYYESYLSSFGNWLKKNNASGATIKNYLSDVREYLEVISSQKQL